MTDSDNSKSPNRNKMMNAYFKKRQSAIELPNKVDNYGKRFNEEIKQNVKSVFKEKIMKRSKSFKSPKDSASKDDFSNALSDTYSPQMPNGNGGFIKRKDKEDFPNKPARINNY
jgi:hypothetical protein